MNCRNLALLLLATLFTVSLSAQSGKLDELQGYKALRVGSDIKSLAAELNLVLVESTDPYSAPFSYYTFKNLKGSEYATIFETEVQEIRLFEHEGKVIDIGITFVPQGKLNLLSAAFAAYYDADLSCDISAMSDQWGSCLLEGEKVSFAIERIVFAEEPSEAEYKNPKLTPIYVGIYQVR
jgi:hypothetical protein